MDPTFCAGYTDVSLGCFVATCWVHVNYGQHLYIKEARVSSIDIELLERTCGASFCPLFNSWNLYEEGVKDLVPAVGHLSQALCWETSLLNRNICGA